MFYGSFVAIVTPMELDGRIAIDSLRNLVAWHVAQGTQGIVAVGSTGEGATLTPFEQHLIIQHVVQEVAGRIPVIAGTGSNCTQKTIEMTAAAKALGVDGCLLVTPYYNKPTQAGLYAHYAKINAAVAIPQILYNVPSRTSCEIGVETLSRLAADCPHIVSLKEANGAPGRYQAVLAAVGNKMTVLTGDDATVLTLIEAGGAGDISVTANVAPHLMARMIDAARKQDFVEAHAINKKLEALHRDLFVESNPIPVKWALAQMGLIPEGIRLPLTPLSQGCHDKVRAAMRAAQE